MSEDYNNQRAEKANIRKRIAVEEARQRKILGNSFHRTRELLTIATLTREELVERYMRAWQGINNMAYVASRDSKKNCKKYDKPDGYDDEPRNLIPYTAEELASQAFEERRRKEAYQNMFAAHTAHAEKSSNPKVFLMPESEHKIHRARCAVYYTLPERTFESNNQKKLRVFLEKELAMDLDYAEQLTGWRND